MIRISDYQLETMNKEFEGKFLERLDSHLCKYFRSEYGLRENSVRAVRLRNIFETARSVGLKTEYDICVFANICVAVGQDRVHFMVKGLSGRDIDSQGHIKSIDRVHRKLVANIRERLEKLSKTVSHADQQ